MNQKLKTREGFTLIETIMAMGVIVVGLVGSLLLLAASSARASILKDRVIAAHLAEEGIEVARNIRDTNWLKNFDWRANLPDTAVGIVDYDSQAIDTSDGSEGRRCLNWNGSFYRHAAGPGYACSTSFKRRIELRTLNETIAGQSVDYLEVKSVVEWREKGQNQVLNVIDHLYDWK